MRRVKIQFTRNDKDFGELPLNFQEVLPYHCEFTGKLDRGNNDIGYLVWPEQMPAMRAYAEKNGAILRELEV
jgi:hypothetical protein